MFLQEFVEKFTKQYLKQYLPTKNVSIEVQVSYPKHEGRFNVLMKLGIGKTKNAIITSGWYNVVKAYGLEEGEIVSFHFWECKKGDLHLSIIHV